MKIIVMRIIDLLAVTPTITTHTMTDYERIFVESMLGLVGNNVDLYARWQLMTDVQKMRVAYYQENCIKLDTAMNARKENTSTILFPMYCDSPGGKIERGGDPIVNKDLDLFSRKRFEFYDTIVDLDDGLKKYKVDVDTEVGKEFRRGQNRDPCVPPNMLFFHLVMHGYLGYDPTTDILKDAGAVVMGGAIVAVATSWSDDNVRGLFEDSGLIDLLTGGGLVGDRLAQYLDCREMVVNRLNSIFIHNPKKTEEEMFDQRKKPSHYAGGDVDIFVERDQEWKVIEKGINELLEGDDQLSLLVEDFYCGGMGYQNNRIVQYLKLFREKALKPKEDEMIPPGDPGLEEEGAQVAVEGLSDAFVVSASGRCISLEYVSTCEYKTSCIWPRLTQLIQVPTRANKELVLIDFDISLCAMQYDGEHVMMTPRAALSLRTGHAFITPMLMEDPRCKKRLHKYRDRGFEIVIVDPNCMHDDPIQYRLGERVDDHVLVRHRTYRDRHLSGGVTPEDNRIMKIVNKPGYHVQDEFVGPGDFDHGRRQYNMEITSYQERNGILWMCRCIGDDCQCRCNVIRKNELCDDTLVLDSCHPLRRSCCINNPHGVHTWPKYYSFCMMEGNVEENLSILSDICGWSRSHESRVRSFLANSDPDRARQLVMCPSVRYLMIGWRLVNRCADLKFYTSSSGKHMDQSGDPIRSEVGVIGFCDPTKYIDNPNKEPAFDFYSGATGNMGLAKTGVSPKIIYHKYLAKKNMDMLLHLMSSMSGESQDRTVDVMTHFKKFLPRFIVYVVNDNTTTLEEPQTIFNWRTFHDSLRNTVLQRASKNPLGLNPERTCKECDMCSQPYKMMFREYRYDICWDCEATLTSP